MTRKNQTYFTRNQLSNHILCVSKSEHKVYIPNEIFKELKGYVDEETGEIIEGFFDIEGNKIPDFKSSTHIAYAYARVYLAHWMYRYCKYSYWDDEKGNVEIDEKMIKQILGFPAKSDNYTYITKKGGLLEKLGYIRKESNIPIGYDLEEKWCYHKRFEGGKKLYKEIDDFTYRSDGNSKNRKIDYPVKAFYRKSWAEEECYRNGVFWEVEDTHMIDIDVFIYCMTNKELGVEGFYLYSFMSMMSDKYKGSFDCSIKRLIEFTGLGERTVRDQLKELEKRNMISNDHKPYCLNKKDWQITKANTYKVLPANKFISNESEFKVIPKQERISAERYESEIGFVVYENALVTDKEVIVTNEELPF
ncbi:hypothetical protein MTP04_34380 [Lysinibacillus sp. PLM2]|nr:hypothetical protein MTP04_34380 [Lysinibacillus sp. PLM2]